MEESSKEDINQKIKRITKYIFIVAGVIWLAVIVVRFINPSSPKGPDACKCVSVFNGQSLKKSMGGVAGGDDYNRCLGKYKNWSSAQKACAKSK